MTPPGTVVAGRYRLDEQLFDTGTSELWSTTDTTTGLPGPLELFPVDGNAEAFLRNAATLASISDPTLIPITGYGVDPAGGYLVLAGLDATESLVGALYLPDAVRRVIEQLAGALAKLHARGLVHGRLTPASVLREPASTSPTQPRVRLVGINLAGTPITRDDRYASPEQRRGEPATPASDSWSLDAIARMFEEPQLFRRFDDDIPEPGPDALDPGRKGAVTADLAEDPGDWPTAEELAAPPAPAQPAAPPSAPGGMPPTAQTWAPAGATPGWQPWAPRSGAQPPPRAAQPPPKAARPAPAAPSTRLEFAAAYREAIEVARAYPVLFFVHGPDDWDRVQAIIDRRRDVLGAPAVRRGVAAREVADGTVLTIVPTVLGATFEPARLEVVAGDDLRELTFQVTAQQAGPIDGYIDIFVGPLVLGQVPVAFDVQAAPTVPTQGGSQLLKVANASVFDTIFVSYSHKDSGVVDLCVATYEGLGVRVLVDKHELRSGDEWRPALRSLIERADIFQLYWSAAASASREVADEWRQAAALASARDRFIRPLYWETPLPVAPEPLDRLHFSKLDLKALRRAAKVYLPAKPGLLRRLLGR